MRGNLGNLLLSWLYPHDKEITLIQISVRDKVFACQICQICQICQKGAIMHYFFVNLQFYNFLIKHTKSLLTNLDEEATIR